MMPRSCTGANTADRAPTATRRSPRRSRRQASARSPSERALWSTATWSPNAPRSRLTVWGVSPISGTRTIAPCPPGQGALHRLEIDQGLPAAGHAEQERALAGGQRLDRGERGRLRRCGNRGRRRAGRVAEGIAHPLRRGESRESLLHQPSNHRLAEAELLDDMAHLGAAAQRLERLVELAAAAAAPEQRCTLEQRGRLAVDRHHPLGRRGAAPCREARP